MQKDLTDVLNDLISRKGIIAAAIFGTDGLVIESASHKNIDMDRIGALFGIYFANTANNMSKMRLIPLPKKEAASYVLFANVSGALLALFTDDLSKADACEKFEEDIHQVNMALTKDDNF